MQGIFKIENKLNGKIYIGMSKDVNNRINDIKSNASVTVKDKLFVEECILSEGIDNFIFELIEEVEDETILLSKKSSYVKKYNSDVKGYNRLKYIDPKDFKMSFGKYAGVNFKYIPKDYFDWFENNVMSNNEINDRLKSLQRKYKLFFRLVECGELEYSPKEKPNRRKKR